MYDALCLCDRGEDSANIPFITAKGLTARMDRIAVREAIKDEILLVHTEGHWDRVRGTGCEFHLSLSLSKRGFLHHPQLAP